MVGIPSRIVAPRGVAGALIGLLGVLSLSAPSAHGAPAQLADLDADALDRRAAHDLRLLKSYTLHVGRLRAAIERAAPLFVKDAEAALTPRERAQALALFEQVVSYSIGLESIVRFHFDFWRVGLTDDAHRHGRHFALAYAAYLLQVELGLLFIDHTLGRPQFESLLDEGAPEHGLSAGAYGTLKWNVVHLEDVGRIFAAFQYHRVLGLASYRGHDDDKLLSFCRNLIDSTYPRVKSRLGHSGVRLFSGNGLDILADQGHRVWFPVQTEVAEWMGDTKVRRLEDMLIQPRQIQEAVRRSRPGDILLERRNWYLSNVGLPGFWPHAALYLGTAGEMRAYLDDDDEVTRALGQPFTTWLQARHPRAWATFTSTDEAGHPMRVIEAMSEGVVFTTAEHSLAADYAAALRPKISKVEVARAIDRAFAYLFRPYDFDFDFFTDRSLVCSELVYKAYEPVRGKGGLRWGLDRIMGRMTLGPNSMARQFDERFGTERAQLDFVWFLDGKEKAKTALWSTLEAFRNSWRRPKWDVTQR